MRNVISVSLLGLIGAAAGCSATSGAWEGAKVAMNLSKDSSYVEVALDGQKAEQNTAKKAYTGHSDWKVKDPVATAPRLRYEITKPEKLGRITSVTVSIFQEFRSDYSNQPEFTIVARNPDPASQMQPNTDYDLANPGAGFRVMDLDGKEVSGVELKPGMKYKLVLTVRADKSETAQVEFKTR
jgi:hypothetical protein